MRPVEVGFPVLPFWCGGWRSVCRSWCAAGPAGLQPCSAQPWGLQGALGARWGPLWGQEDPVLICVLAGSVCPHPHGRCPALRPPRSSPFDCWNGAAGSLASSLVSAPDPCSASRALPALHSRRPEGCPPLVPHTDTQGPLFLHLPGGLQRRSALAWYMVLKWD